MSPNNPFRIRTRTGQTLTVEIDPDETIAEVKRKVAEKEGIPPEEQRLIFRGVAVQEQPTLIQDQEHQLTIREILKKQDLIIEEQDRALDDLAETVKRIKHIGLQMNSEITTQNRMLDDLNQDVDLTNQRVGKANKNISKLHRNLKKGSCLLL